MLSPDIKTQIAALAARYGTPHCAVARLDSAPVRPLTSKDRSGEVCMVVRRTNGKLLTATKTFYPPGAFRLLTGGINHRESIEAALLRETYEETGLDVVVQRFLAVIEYHLPALPSRTFATFAFLLDETGGTLGPRDTHERLGEFREVAVDELPRIADALEHVGDGFHPEIVGSWRDWGRFRAVVHRVVYQALTG